MTLRSTAFGPLGILTIVGSDTSNNWVNVADGAKTYTDIFPLNSAATGGAVQNANIVAGGGTGAPGDYLKRINFNVSATTNAAVYLKDGTISTAPNIFTSSTDAGNAVTLAVTTPNLSSTAFTCTVNQHVNRILTMTYLPTSHVGNPIIIKRKIVSHAAFTGATASIVFTVTHNWPAGASPTGWAIEHISSKEIVPFNQPVGVGAIDYGVNSINGPWILSVDTTVVVEVTGKFTA